MRLWALFFSACALAAELAQDGDGAEIEVYTPVEYLVLTATNPLEGELEPLIMNSVGPHDDTDEMTRRSDNPLAALLARVVRWEVDVALAQGVVGLGIGATPVDVVEPRKQVAKGILAVRGERIAAEVEDVVVLDTTAPSRMVDEAAVPTAEYAAECLRNAPVLDIHAAPEKTFVAPLVSLVTVIVLVGVDVGLALEEAAAAVEEVAVVAVGKPRRVRLPQPQPPRVPPHPLAPPPPPPPLLPSSHPQQSSPVPPLHQGLASSKSPQTTIEFVISAAGKPPHQHVTPQRVRWQYRLALLRLHFLSAVSSEVYLSLSTFNAWFNVSVNGITTEFGSARSTVQPSNCTLSFMRDSLSTSLDTTIRVAVFDVFLESWSFALNEILFVTDGTGAASGTSPPNAQTTIFGNSASTIRGSATGKVLPPIAAALVFGLGLAMI
ncbi:hypothetical protein ONZ45_g11706 [Pleurotus djamor]|nr:hypothetical protein ONZ45_g11706 [Pleurotus djamor]